MCNKIKYRRTKQYHWFAVFPRDDVNFGNVLVALVAVFVDFINDPEICSDLMRRFSGWDSFVEPDLLDTSSTVECSPGIFLFRTDRTVTFPLFDLELF